MINLRDQFGHELFRANLNLAELDGKPCIKCGKIPPVIKKKINGKVVIDRSGRVDCDEGTTKERLVTYCRKCWLETASELGSEMTT